MHMRHIAISALPPSTIFFHIISQTARFSREKSYWTQNVCFDFLYKFYLKHFSLYEELNEIWSQMDVGLQVKYPLFLSDFNETCIFLRHIFEKRLNMKLREPRHVGAELFLVDRQTDRHDETNSRFSQFCECALNRTSHTAIFEALNSRVVQGSSLMTWNAVSMGEWLLAFRRILMSSSSRMFDPRIWLSHARRLEAFASFTYTVLPRWVTSPLWTLPSSLRATLNVDGHTAASSSKIRLCSDEGLRPGRLRGCGVIRACVSSDTTTTVQCANYCSILLTWRVTSRGEPAALRQLIGCNTHVYLRHQL